MKPTRIAEVVADIAASIALGNAFGLIFLKTGSYITGDLYMPATIAGGAWFLFKVMYPKRVT